MRPATTEPRMQNPTEHGATDALSTTRTKAIADGFTAVAVDAIIAAWPDQAVEILGQLGKAGDHYFFRRWGMYVGVEDDGYIHT